MSLAESTSAGRDNAVRAFARFCIYYKLSFCPTNSDVLCEYAAWLASSGVKAGSITTYLVHIRQFHLAARHPDPVTTQVDRHLVSSTMAGVRRYQQYRPMSKAPLTPVELMAIRGRLNWASSLHRTFWAALCIGFWTFLRGSNLLLTSAKAFVPGQHVAVTSITNVSPEGYHITLSRTKTVQFNERSLLIPVRSVKGHAMCPLAALHDMWELAPPGASPSIFVYVDSKGRTVPLLRSRFSKLIKHFCALVGLDPSKYSGHSLRKGGATCAFIAGCDETMVKLQGDWVSDAYQRYVTFSVQQKSEVPLAVASKLCDSEFLERYVVGTR